MLRTYDEPHTRLRESRFKLQVMSLLKTSQNPSCSPDEIAVKSIFLGPQAENSIWLREQTLKILDRWFDWRKSLSKGDPPLISPLDRQTAEYRSLQKEMEEEIEHVLGTFENEIPSFHPRYIGHMMSEISLPALMGHLITLLHNPNNISTATSVAGSRIEQEALSIIAKAIGLNHFEGHFTSGGTIANFEFLIRARDRLGLWQAISIALDHIDLTQMYRWTWEEYDHAIRLCDPADLTRYNFVENPGNFSDEFRRRRRCEPQWPVLLVPGSRHYSWPKAAHDLGLGKDSLMGVDMDRDGRLCIQSLKEKIEFCLQNKKPIIGIVGVFGTTEMGSLDPFHEIQDLLEQFHSTEGIHLWLHADAAFGGLLTFLREEDGILSLLGAKAKSSLDALRTADSFTIDPHKLGYVPYSSGVFLCSDSRNYMIRSHMGPYVSGPTNMRGKYTLEGSRSAAGAVATLLSLKSTAPTRSFAKVLKRTCKTKHDLIDAIQRTCPHIYFPGGLDTNIVCLSIHQSANKISDANRMTRAVEKMLLKRGKFRASSTVLSYREYQNVFNDFTERTALVRDTDELFLLRMTLMNPFFSSREDGTNMAEDFASELSETIQTLRIDPTLA